MSLSKSAVLALGLVLGAGLAARAEAQVVFPTFATKVDFAAGANPISVAVADVNGDGKPDLVTANFYADTVSVRLGDGSGGFAAKMDFATGVEPISVAVGDLNGDGKPDLVVANSTSNTVSVLLGNGDGTFGGKTDFPTGFSPRSVAIGDVNRDGKPDLVVTSYTSRTVAVLLGNGDGTFGGKTDFPTGFGPISVAIGDLNGDGKPDLVVANFLGDNFSVLLGDGSGGFAAPMNFPFGVGPSSVAIGDLNGDGKADVAIANLNNNSVSVLLGTGFGTFATKNDFAAGASPRSVAIGDVNGDGKPDLVLANQGDNTVSVLRGLGDGSFALPANFTTGPGPSSVAIADLNRDGMPDLAVANAAVATGGNTVSVLLNTTAFTPSGSFAPPVSFATGPRPRCVAIGDLNRDGMPDLAVTNSLVSGDADPSVSVLLGTGTGSFGPKTDFAAGRFPSCLAIGDLNRDGKPDLAVTNATAAGVSVLLGDGTGGFGLPLNLATGGASNSVAIGDLNRDRIPDLVVANATSHTISVLLGNWDGTFRPKIDQATGIGEPVSVAIGDLNGDGIPDLAVAHQGSAAGSDYISVFLGAGNGMWWKRIDIVLTGGDPNSVAIGDLNRDGKPDLVVGKLNATTVSVLLGNGDGTFGSETNFPTGLNPLSVAIGDLNRDGKPDLATANYSDNTVSILFGNGDGTFGPKTDFPAGISPLSVAIADLNGDGKPDLVVTNENADAVSVLLNTAPFSVTKTDAPDPVAVGNPLTYTITVTNSGNAAVADVRVSDPLPAGVTFVSATPTQGSCSGTSTVTCSLGTLAVGATATVTIVVTPTAVGTITNTATVTGTVAGPHTATATTTVNPAQTLVVVRAGSGSGTVTSYPAGITCGPDCSEIYPSGQVVALMASAAADSRFTGWTGCDSVSGVSCTVTMNANRIVQATFTRVFTLTVSKAGTGSGTVASSPAGIDCGATCSASFLNFTSAELTAPADAGSTFTGWTGCDSVSGAFCIVTMNADRTVTATFDADPTSALLTVIRRGSGNGSVTSNLPGITCGSDCSEIYPVGITVILTAAPAPGATLQSWGVAGCPATSLTCTVRLSADLVIPVTFSKVFTDDPLTAGSTLIKAAHITDLRSAIDALYARLRSVGFAWGGSTLVPGSTPVRRVHLMDLRDALWATYQVYGRILPTYAESIVAEQTVIKASHLSELRSLIRALE